MSPHADPFGDREDYDLDGTPINPEHSHLGAPLMPGMAEASREAAAASGFGGMVFGEGLTRGETPEEAENHAAFTRDFLACLDQS